MFLIHPLGYIYLVFILCHFKFCSIYQWFNQSVYDKLQMGVVKSIAQSYSWNEYLYWYIERNDIPKIEWVLDNKPDIVDKPLTANYRTTPLHRAAVNGSVKICELLIEKYKANVNGVTEVGETALMGAAKRDKIEVVRYLLRMGADVDLVSGCGLLAVEYAILAGLYEVALMIYERMKNRELKHPLDYQEMGAKFLYRYVNYKIFVENLLLRVEPENVPDFLTKPKKVFNDPVVDPRETWKKWFLRQMDWKDPPLCQRSELPEEMQPQNRRFGKIMHYFSKITMTHMSQKPSYLPRGAISEMDTKQKLVLSKMQEYHSEKNQGALSQQKVQPVSVQQMKIESVQVKSRSGGGIEDSV